MRKWIIAVIGVAVVAAGLYFFGPFRTQAQSAAAGNLQTAPAERGDLTATIGATGEVRANQTTLLTWGTSGTVEKVNAAVGDQIAVGQVLASLEQTSLSQPVIMAQADLVNAQKALDDLKNSQLQQANAQKAVEDAQKALEDAQDPELTQAKALEDIATAQKAVDQAQNAVTYSQSTADQSLIDEAQAQVVLAKDALDKAKERFVPYEKKPEDNLKRARLQSEMAAAQQRYDAAVRKLNALKGTASQVDQAVAQANLETAKAQLLEAQRNWERVKDGPSAAEIAVLKAQLEDAQREWERVKDGPDPDDLAAAEARVAAAQAAVDQARLTAPFEGTITEVVSKPGDQVTPGSRGFRLDDLSRLLVDVQVSEVDINRIQPGQDVRLTFDAILNKEYHGTVSEVALVGSSDQGVVDFTVTVELTDADAAVKPGMTAAVNVVVDQLKDVLLVPNRAVRVQEGQRVVYILKNGQPEAIPVALGASSDTMSQVLESDLKVGDAIVLNPPTVFDQGGPPPFVQR
jgi:HlyD family secretion protein